MTGLIKIANPTDRFTATETAATLIGNKYVGTISARRDSAAIAGETIDEACTVIRAQGRSTTSGIASAQYGCVTAGW